MRVLCIVAVGDTFALDVQVAAERVGLGNGHLPASNKFAEQTIEVLEAAGTGGQVRCGARHRGGD